MKRIKVKVTYIEELLGTALFRNGWQRDGMA